MQCIVKYNFLKIQMIKIFIYSFSYCRCCFVTKSYLTLCDPMDCSLLVSSGHRIFQAKILEWVVIYLFMGSFPLRIQTQVSFLSGDYLPLSHLVSPNSFFTLLLINNKYFFQDKNFWVIIFFFLKELVFIHLYSKTSIILYIKFLYIRNIYKILHI